ncbi:MAG: hypothetical protein ABIF11_06500 [Nitrospirota bacterium]
MSKALTVEIQDSIFQKLLLIAKEKKCKVEEFVTAVVNESVENKVIHINDPFFKQKGYRDDGLKDVSMCHDKYLYEMDKQ